MRSIQSNKVALIAQCLNQARPANLPFLNVYLQVNSSKESSNSGLDIGLQRMPAKEHLTRPKLKLRGVMAIAARSPGFAKQRMQFKIVADAISTYQQQVLLDALPMAMSDNFVAAIQEGATMVRIGSHQFWRAQSSESPLMVSKLRLTV